MRYVTETSLTQRGHRREGEHALSNAERQARSRARLASPTAPTPHPRHSADRRSRPQGWRDAVAELPGLQAEYTDWPKAVPTSLRNSTAAEALKVITELDLEALTGIQRPKGYARD